MFTDLYIYIEALLIDEDLADQVWSLWDREAVSDGLVFAAWSCIVCGNVDCAQIVS